MLTIEAELLRECLPWDRLIEALRAMFAQGCAAPLRHRHPLPQRNAPEGSLLLMPAWLPHRYTGVKIVHVAPGAVPAVRAVYLLSDGESGAPLALLDGGELTDRRTAAASLLAAGYLARPDSSRLLLLGSGKVARALGEAWCARFPITDVAVWSRDPAHAERLAAHLAGEGRTARAVPAPDPAEADIISAATLATTPLFAADAVRPGTHVDLVGAFRPEMRESEGALLARATLAVDTRTGALAEAGDVVQAIREGAITEAHVAADLFDLTRGAHPGRTRDDEITVFKSVGWAGEDLAAAMLAYEAATSR